MVHVPNNLHEEMTRPKSPAKVGQQTQPPARAEMRKKGPEALSHQPYLISVH